MIFQLVPVIGIDGEYFRALSADTVVRYMNTCSSLR